MHGMQSQKDEEQNVEMTVHEPSQGLCQVFIGRGGATEQKGGGGRGSGCIYFFGGINNDILNYRLLVKYILNMQSSTLPIHLSLV